jgi:competence protein ComEC
MGDSGFGSLLEIAAERGVRVREVGRGDPPATIGDLHLLPIWPPRDGIRRSRNDRSLVVKISFLGREASGDRILLTGDLGIEAEEELLRVESDLACEILKVGHHGSRHSSSEAFLAAVAPALALVSAPCSSRAGLPSRDALERLSAEGARVAWTGREGALMVGLEVPGRDRRLESFRVPRRCRPAEP